MTSRILRLPSVIERVGFGRSTIYTRIAQGLFPPPIRLGARASGWTESEIEAINRAVAASAAEESLKELVRSLVAARKEAA